MQYGPAYSLQCGGVFNSTNKTNTRWVKVTYESMYHVKSGLLQSKWDTWESFDTYREAAKFADNERKR